MNRVSCGEFASMLLICDVFTLLCLMGNISVLTAAGFLTGTAVQLLFALPAAYYYKNGGTLRYAPKIFVWFYLLYIVLWGGLLFVMLWNASEEITIPAENIPILPEKVMISGLIAAVCLYAAAPGEKAVARAALISAALGAVCIVMIVISAIPGSRMEYLSDMSHADGYFYEVMRGFVLSGGLGSFVVLLGFTKASPVKCTWSYFISKAVLYTAVTLTAAAAAGGIMEISDFPVITAAELSQPFSSQRIDSLFLIIFVIFAVFAVSVQAVTASYLLGILFPGFRRFRSTAVILAMTASGFFLSGLYQYSVIYSICTAAAISAPLGMIAAKKLRAKE